MPLKEIFKDIFDTTGYQILFDKKWENERVTVKLDNVSLIQSLKKILKNAEIQNYSLIEKDKTITIYTCGSKSPGNIASNIHSDGTGLTEIELKALHEKQMQEIHMRAVDPNEILIPGSNGKPGVTRQELQALHERQKMD